VTRPDTAWGERLERLATTGPQPGEREAAAAFISECERLTAAARGLIHPTGAVSPAKARLMRYPITPKS
jgi:hypothetical protein